MALVNRSFQLDIAPGAIPQVVKVSEYDQNRQYTVTLIDEGGVFEIPSGTTATVEGSIGGNAFSESATVSGNTITFTLTESMTAKAGDVWCKIKLTKDSKPIQTAAFILRCDRAGVEADTVIDASGFEEQIADAAGAWLEKQGFSSPTVDVQEITGGHRVTVTDYQHTDSFDVMDGEDGDTVAVDTSLTHSGEAADAKATGDRLTALETAQIETDDTLEVSGAAADAAAVGNRFAEINPYIEYIKELMIEEQMRDFDVSAIDSEWQQNTKDALKQTLLLGDGYVHFLIATDMHINNTSNSFINKVKPIADALMETGKYDKFINLGDVMNHGTLAVVQQAKTLGYFWGVDDGKCLFTMGNHDYEDNAMDAFQTEVFQYIAQIPNVTFKEASGEVLKNYYYDVPAYKLRMLFADSNNTSIEDSFFRTAITSLPSGWKYMVFSHHPNVPDKTWMRMQYEMPGNYLGKVHGHDHHDRLYMQYGLLYDTYLNAAYLTVMSVNPEKNDVRFFRIGVDYPAMSMGGAVDESAVLGGITNHKFGYAVDQTYKPEALNGYKYKTTDYAMEASSEAKILTRIFKSTGARAFLRKTNGGNWSTTPDVNRMFSFADETWESHDAKYRQQTATFLDPTFTVIYQKARQMSVGINDDLQLYDVEEIPDGFHESIVNEWAFGMFSSSGEIHTSSTAKYNTRCIKVKPNTTYRFTQPEGTEIGTFEYLVRSSIGSTWSRGRKTVASNTVTVTTGETTKYIAICVYNPADDMSTCTFEEVTT